MYHTNTLVSIYQGQNPPLIPNPINPNAPLTFPLRLAFSYRRTRYCNSPKENLNATVQLSNDTELYYQLLFYFSPDLDLKLVNWTSSVPWLDTGSNQSTTKITLPFSE